MSNLSKYYEKLVVRKRREVEAGQEELRVVEGHNDDNGKSGSNASEHFISRYYFNILQSMGHAVCIFKLSGEIAYWNRSAEILYGYSSSEIVGHNIVQLLVHKNNIDFENELVNQLAQGHSWKGQLLFKKKSGDIFPALVTNTPLYNESGVFVGVISVTHDARPLNGEATVIDNHSSVSSEAGDRANKNNEMGKSKVEFQQLFEHPIASKVSNVASKVTSKVRSWMHNGDNVECEGGIHRGKCSEHLPHINQASDHREYHNANFNEKKAFKDTRISFNSGLSPHFTPFRKLRGTSESNTCNEGEKKKGICNTLGSKAETWMAKKGKLWKWGGECHVEEIKNHFVTPWMNIDKENDSENHKKKNTSYRRESYSNDVNKSRFNDCSILWLSNNAASVSHNGRISSINCRNTKSLEIGLGTLDCEILWEDLTIGEYLGQGNVKLLISISRLLCI
ncbi:uncharacterized protein LOC131060764 isoform X1 [Cryptomeria japonica]|uniref:uncharacterized protein LOC131060764 isoform X1 n=1 Tax=Cryptomeria japonica TaxID=3369 RepID=UPI0025ABB91A|nr:uncharacterized protein LOC131060764 isoform X1 [Cryptomeria japonica]